MAKNKTAEDKASAKNKKEEKKKGEKQKEGKKKQGKVDKVHDFQTDVRVINQGEVSKATNISRESVKKYSSPKKSEKAEKAAPAKFFKNRVEFKDSIVLGNKKKKILEYSQVRMIEQLDSDSRMAFVNYEAPKNDHYFVLGLKDANEVKRFMNLVKESNSMADIRWPKALLNADSDGYSVGGGDGGVTLTQDQSVDNYNTYSRPQTPENHQQSDSDHSLSNSQQDKQWKTTSSFICADPYVDDRTVHTRGTPDTFGTQLKNPVRRSHRNDSFDSYDEIEDNRRGIPLTTNYYCCGASDEEDFVVKDKYRVKSKKFHRNPRRQNYGSDDDLSISMDSSIIMTETDFFPPEVYKKPRTPNVRRPPSHKRSVSRRSSKRSKSRELPLSEAEKSRGGWHSDVMFVTPTKNGGVKVSADGPVMLYTATRANVNRDLDSDDSTSDGDGEFSSSSESTIMLENHGTYGMSYFNGHR